MNLELGTDAERPYGSVLAYCPACSRSVDLIADQSAPEGYRLAEMDGGLHSCPPPVTG